MIHYSNCPVCGSEKISPALATTDYSVSSLSFTICKCTNCTALFTQDIPDLEAIGSFYNSENYVSHTNTELGLINRLYHLVRKRTLVFKRHLVIKETGIRNGKILDVGCGTGSFLNEMKNHDWQVTGIEPDETARKNANNLFQINPLSAPELLNFSPESFDAITMWHVLEHVHPLQEYVVQLKKMLKKNGRLFVAVPNYTCYDEEVYTEFWAAYDVPRHLYHFSPTSITQLLLRHGLQLKEIKPMWYDSFYVSMLSEKYKTGKNNLLSAAWNGYVSNWKTLFNKEKCSSVIYIIGK